MNQLVGLPRSCKIAILFTLATIVVSSGVQAQPLDGGVLEDAVRAAAAHSTSPRIRELANELISTGFVRHELFEQLLLRLPSPVELPRSGEDIGEFTAVQIAIRAVQQHSGSPTPLKVLSAKKDPWLGARGKIDGWVIVLATLGAGSGDSGYEVVVHSKGYVKSIDYTKL